MPRVSFTLYSLTTGLPVNGLGPTVISFTRINSDGTIDTLANPAITDTGAAGVYFFDVADAALPTGSLIRYVIDCTAGASARYEDGQIEAAAAVVPEDDESAEGTTPAATPASDTAIWTWDDVNSLKASIAAGVLTVTYSGPPSRTVTYQSLPAMRSLLAEMVADLRGADGTRQAFRFATTRKGLG